MYGGSVEEFANLMNNKAKDLGLENTHYVTPHGLDNPEHYTTAYELAKLADYALTNEKFAKVVGTKNYTVTINGHSKSITNTNELLGYLEGVNGVKTGFTNNAGRCLVTSVSRNGFNIITVVLQADTKKFRTSDSIKLIQYVYENYEPVDVKAIVDDKFTEWKRINENRIYINKAKQDNVKLYKTDLAHNTIPVKKTEKDNIDIEVKCIYYFEAPLEANKPVGTLKLTLNNKTIDMVEVKSKNQVQKRQIIDYLNLFAIQLFS